MSNELELKKCLREAFAKRGLNLSDSDIVIERSKESSHGDYSTNAAMKCAKMAHCNPRELACYLQQNLQSDLIDHIEVAGPGFVNFFMKKGALQGIIGAILANPDTYGRSPRNGKKIDVEFVSANPTGNLHLGHTRIAVVGDVISNLLDWAGYDVTREYYLNDCGNQVEHLGHSLRGRYHELFGEPCELDADDYHGTDIIEIAKQLKEEKGDSLLVDNQETHDFFIEYGIKAELAKIKRDLDEFRVHFDVLTKESDIRKGNTIENTIKELSPHIYEKDGAYYLKTSDYLDDKDRPIIKSNGQYTYFMPDICYHYNKMSRGFDLLIDVLGADHHGYINRMKSALMMKGYPADSLEVELVQVVRTFRDGVEVKMSKRTGQAITHRELVAECGVDAVRYLFAERSQSSHLDFNYNLAMQQSSENPVFYAQYAHARCCSVLSLGQDIPLDPSGTGLDSEVESALLKQLACFPSAICSAAAERAPHKMAAYIHKTAELVHEFYAKARIIDRNNISLTSSRLALIKASEIVLKNALSLLGVSAPSKM